MKATAMQGYLISRAMIDMYIEDENKTDNDILELHRILTVMTQMYVRKGHNILKQVERAWNIFTSINKDDKEIEVIPFACNLVIKNPNASKNKNLRDLALRINKKFLFVKEDSIILAKKMVNEFYGVGDV